MVIVKSITDREGQGSLGREWVSSLTLSDSDVKRERERERE